MQETLEAENTRLANLLAQANELLGNLRVSRSRAVMEANSLAARVALLREALLQITFRSVVTPDTAALIFLAQEALRVDEECADE